MSHPEPFPDAALAESAHFAWQIAPRTCRVDPPSGESCAAAHGAWQYLRLLGLIGTLEYRAGFYARALGSLDTPAARPRVLVSGAADYGMLACVVSALAGRDPAVTVLDLCETPLAVNRRYAERCGARIDTARCDILEYESARPFDLICTDSFLGRFPAAARPALAARWRSLLRPGGMLVTANALRPQSAPGTLGFSAAQARALGEAARAAAAGLGDKLAVSGDELAALAEAYARQQLTYTVRSADEIRAQIEDAGLRMEEIETLRVDAGAGDNPAAPSVRRRNAAFLTIVARRA